MNTSTPIIDIHSHATLKPYGNSFYPNQNPKLDRDSACIWTQDKEHNLDTKHENLVGISRYRQSDFKSNINGQIKIVMISLYPPEIGFFKTRPNFPDRLERLIGQYASLFGYDRIDYLMDKGPIPYNYFDDLNKEYQYLKLLDNQKAFGGSHIYNLISNATQLNTVSNLLVIPTIEGAHVFCNGTDVKNPENWKNLDQRVKEVKAWDHPPIFITLAHHFYNGLCTHAESLTGMIGKLLDQSYGMRIEGKPFSDHEKAISPFGYQLIDLLLKKDNGRRILIDVKHMSIEARKAYYKHLDDKYKNDNIPIICSHGAVDRFYNYDINMNCEMDIKRIYQSNGLIGLEMDQRILGYNHNRFIKWIKAPFRRKSKNEFIQAGYFWQNLIEIAEYAYQNGFKDDPWKCICSGSDFDGIINPLNDYRSTEKLPDLYRYLIEYLNIYWQNNNSIIQKNHNGWNSENVIYRIMYKNAYEFIERNYL
jgi:hypothetical protein